MPRIELSELERQKLAKAGADSISHQYEWRPIDTAPKDGTYFLVLCERYKDEAGPDIFQAVYEEEFFDEWEFNLYVPMPSDKRGTYEPLYRDATHWMPLPAPPKESK
jgi:Protein of unknown function (DUF551)